MDPGLANASINNKSDEAGDINNVVGHEQDKFDVKSMDVFTRMSRA